MDEETIKQIKQKHSKVENKVEKKTPKKTEKKPINLISKTPKNGLSEMINTGMNALEEINPKDVEEFQDEPVLVVGDQELHGKDLVEYVDQKREKLMNSESENTNSEEGEYD
jgi:hypothetical protein